MLELFLVIYFDLNFQVDAYCQAQGLKIAGYYQANELLKDLE